MSDINLRAVLCWTAAYAMFAVLMIAGQPGSFVEDLPSVGASTTAARMAVLDKAAAPRWQLASAE